jgi:hypothetical protein
VKEIQIIFADISLVFQLKAGLMQSSSHSEYSHAFPNAPALAQICVTNGALLTHE